MPILVKCPTKGCGKILNVPDSAAGRTIRCPACGNPVQVPSSAAGKGGSSVIDLSDTSDAYAVADEPETDYSTIAAPPPAFTGPYVRKAAVSRASVGGLLTSIVAMLVGALLLTTKGALAMPGLGDLLVISAAACWGVEVAAARALVDRHGPPLLAFVGYSIGIPILGAAFALSKPAAPAWAVPWAAASGATVSACVMLYYQSVKLLGAIKSNVLAHLLGPAICAALAFAFLGEALEPIQLAGVAILLAGAAALSARL